MNSNSRNPRRKFPLSLKQNAIDDKTLHITLAVCAGLALSFTLLLYALLSDNKTLSRLHYGVFVSVLPAAGTLVVLKLTKLPVGWKGVVLIYVLLFILVFIQFFVRSSLGQQQGGFSSP